ncbi:UDP-N-acetylmuramate--L-alanine ligase [Candidatus Babeliales bacterium]|nr:UDP-N-acetylmuramate--L-alanine ligase [Candidatus Babeliales bacterium]
MYKKREHIHFMGIGGIGMSGIAEIVKLQGYTVSGCDASCEGKTITHLESIGCTVFKDHNASHVHNADVLVYSSAIKKDHQEIVAALERSIPVIPRALMLAELMRTKYSVAVTGAHGKTTTTSLISHIMIEAQKNPTVIVGGVLKNIDSNAQFGDSNLLIAEADESDRSFLYLNPTMAVVTNIDTEHLDTYRDLDDIKQTFQNFLARLPFYGKAIVCIDDPNLCSILPLPHISTVKYGLSSKADIMGKIISLGASQSVFDVFSNKDSKNTPTLLGRVMLNIPGEHNVLNALAALSLCLEFDISFETIAKALTTFFGVERRFEFKGTFKGTDVFDDYGHHPTEIEKTLIVAQRRTVGRLHVVFQPHRYSRTEKLWDEFVNLLASAKSRFGVETLIIADIHAASEEPIPNITSQRLTQAIQAKNPELTVLHCSDFSQIVQVLENIAQPNDLVLTIGAGKIYQVGSEIVSKYRAYP